jgi:hypothetical protein
MFILARGGQCYSRLRYNVGPGADIDLKVDINYGNPFRETDFEFWHQEYLANVQIEPMEPPKIAEGKMTTAAGEDGDDQFLDDWWRDAWSDYANQENEHEDTVFGYKREF